MVYERNPVRFATLRGIVQLRRILKREKYDLVHCHTPTGGVVARLAALGLKDKPIVVYTVHGFHFYKGAPLVNWLVFFPVEWLLSWCTDCIVTIDEEDYQNAQRLHMGMKQLRLIHGVGVRLERYSGPVSEYAKDALRKALQLEGEPLVLTYVAELLENKNQTVLLRALKRIALGRCTLCAFSGVAKRCAADSGRYKHLCSLQPAGRPAFEPDGGPVRRTTHCGLGKSRPSGAGAEW